MAPAGASGAGGICSQNGATSCAQWPMHALEAMHRRRPVQDLRHQVLNLRIGQVYHRRLGPFLEQEGEFGLGQSQPLIQRRRLNRLPLACAIDHSLELKGPKHRLIETGVRLREPLPHLTRRTAQLLSHIPGSAADEEQPQQLLAHQQHAPPQSALDLMDRLPSLHCRLDKRHRRSHLAEDALHIDIPVPYFHTLH
jgi:hypothetical protein